MIGKELYEKLKVKTEETLCNWLHSVEMNRLLQHR